ncbi:MAG: hypothetical protein ACK53C_09275 [Pseudomonadota bacterium]
MPARRLSWRDKVAAGRASKKVVLDKPFAGIPAGSTLFIATPQIVEQYVREIPSGEARTLVRLRNELARRHRCDATCPVSTSIFLKMVAEAAWEGIQAGEPVTRVAPFWRVIEPGTPRAKKLRVDPAWLERQRAVEGLESAAPARATRRRRSG